MTDRGKTTPNIFARDAAFLNGDWNALVFLEQSEKSEGERSVSEMIPSVKRLIHSERDRC